MNPFDISGERKGGEEWPQRDFTIGGAVASGVTTLLALIFVHIYYPPFVKEDLVVIFVAGLIGYFCYIAYRKQRSSEELRRESYSDWAALNEEMLSGMTEEDREDAEQEFYEVKHRAESLELMWQNQEIGAGFLAAGINALWLGMFFMMFLEGFGL